MTPFSRSGVFLLLISILWRIQLLIAQNNDQLIMVALKKELGIPIWSSNDSSYCSWEGVRCNSDLSSVEMLELSDRKIGGNITLISELKALKWLDLSNNKLQGPIPSSFGNLTQLEFLDLSLNIFGSSIPPELGKLKNLRSLNLSGNYLVSNIPDELKNLENLQDLQVSGNKLNGSIPSWIGNFTKLRFFAAYENDLSGKIPGNLGSLSGLRLLNLHSNLLEGPIPESIFSSGKLEVLVLTMNKLVGNLPISVGNCQGLSNLRIGNNKLTGSIPTSVGNISSLTYFEADNNNLSGEVVREFAQCNNLTLLNLAFNGFTGTVPPEFGELANLQELILSGNSLIGEIPDSLLKCKNLSKLDLSINRLNGTLPRELCKAPKLQFLLVSQNSLRGEIPGEIGNCAKLLELQLGNNYLTGIIPPEMGQIKNLQIALNLSFNHLHGSLPSELGKLDKLVALDISSNQLSGSIPSALKGMLSLIEVNFSHNSLTGQVPIFAPFQKSPNSSFYGNKGLCGEPLGISCGNSFDSDQTYHHKVSYKVVLAVIGSGLAVFVSVSIIVFLFMMREKQEMAAKSEEIAEEKNPDPALIIAGNVFVENLKQAIDFDSVVKATLKESNKLHSGTFSSTYKAVMPSGLILSVKRLNSIDRTVIHHQNKMIRELERLSKLCHEHLIRPVGFVIYEESAILLHNYLPNGTLAQHLRDSITAEKDFEPDWPTRLLIAIGVAEGLAFLHHVAIIHLDISTSNVILDSNLKPLIGEIEISKLLDPSKGTASISAVAGSFGYIPQSEYAYTMQVTAPGNVYSYGVVLLEILTTRSPVDESFGEGIDLVKWVHSAPERGDTPEQILDSRLSTVSFAWRKQMLAVLKVALLCTDTTPAKRPKMKKVVELLQEVN